MRCHVGLGTILVNEVRLDEETQRRLFIKLPDFESLVVRLNPAVLTVGGII